MYPQPNRRRTPETIEQKRRRWAREAREFDARQRQRDREREVEEEALQRQLHEAWERRWAAMSPEERVAYAQREAELEAAASRPRGRGRRAPPPAPSRAK